MYMQKEETTGDHQEFDELYHENYLEIYKFIRCRVADRELAKDVLQETFYIAYKKWEYVRTLSNPTGWLINTAKNKMKELNKKLRKLECEVELENYEYTVIEDGYGKSELNIAILSDLTEAEKQRFYRYFVCGYTIADMARLETVSENNMSVRISRLRDKIAKIISQNATEGLAFDKKQKDYVRIDKKTSYTIEKNEIVDDRIQKGKEQK